MCLEGENNPYVLIYVKSASTKCEASNNFIATLRDCNPHHSDQLWTETPASGGFHLENANGGYLCASGGVGRGTAAKSPQLPRHLATPVDACPNRRPARQEPGPELWA
jgi:hypothetical protein